MSTSAAKANQPFYCGICQKQRQGQNGRCESCGSLVSTAKVKPPRSSTCPPCPKCGTYQSTLRSDGYWHCRTCGGLHEPDDFGFLDDRPDVNAEKRERQQTQRRGKRFR